MCQMKQIKCNNDTVLTEVTMFLLEDFVLLVDFVDLIAPALGISLLTHILFFSLFIFSILEHAAQHVTPLKAGLLSHMYLFHLSHFCLTVFQFLHPPY